MFCFKESVIHYEMVVCKVHRINQQINNMFSFSDFVWYTSYTLLVEFFQITNKNISTLLTYEYLRCAFEENKQCLFDIFPKIFSMYTFNFFTYNYCEVKLLLYYIPWHTNVYLVYLSIYKQLYRILRLRSLK